MGTCSSGDQRRVFPNLYKQYSPQLIEIHAFAVFQLEYLQKRKKEILQESKESISELVSSLFTPIQELEEVVKVFFEEKQRLAFQPALDINTTNRLKSQIQAEIIEVNLHFAYIKNDLSKNLQGLEKQICNYVNQQFHTIEKQTKEKTLRINYTDKIKKEQVDQFLQRLRNLTKGKLKNQTIEIQNKFRLLFNQENYLKAYSKVKLNFEKIYNQLDMIVSVVENGRKKETKQNTKGKLKLLMTEQDQREMEIQIQVQLQLSVIKQKDIIRQLVGDVKQGVVETKQKLSQISNKVIKLQQNWKEQARSLIKTKKKIASSTVKK